MAFAASTSQCLIDKLEEELECSFCLERLEDPKVFPCQHSFCHKCIVDLSRGKSLISCPECRAEVEVGNPPDLSHFKRNHRINNILECMKDDDLCESTNPEIHQCSKDETTSFESDHVSQATIQANRDQRNQTPNNYPQVTNNITRLQSNLDVGSMVEVLSKHQNPKYGLIRWIGFIPNSMKKTAGLELEEEMNACTDGTFLGKRYFTCPSRRGFFVHLHNCLPDSRSDKNSTENAAGKPALKDNSPPFTPQTSEDIVNRKSKFSKQFTDQVIKEQEQLLKKIKQEEGQKTSEKRNCDSSRADSGTSLDDCWWSTNEDRKKLIHVPHNNHGSQATIQVNRDQRNQTPNNYPQVTNNITRLRSNLDVGSMVEVPSKHQKSKYGLIRWIGFIPNSEKKTAGLELEEEMNVCTDGTFLGKRYFTCPSRRGFFVFLHNCFPDSRFN